MFGLNAGYAHVMFHCFPGNDDILDELKSEMAEKGLGGVDVAHRDGDMIEMFQHCGGLLMNFPTAPPTNGAARWKSTGPERPLVGCGKDGP
ncbi:MAG TPA: hypothetical protein VMU18_13330 [Rhodoblastus sp.]|nr:hypothetical protein [Rhodoblastus sp.]